MKMSRFYNQWFLIPTIGIKRIECVVDGYTQYNLCIAWFTRGIDIKIYKKDYEKRRWCKG